MAAPTTVRDVEVTNLLSGFRFLVEWTLNSDAEGITAYKIYRSPNQDAGYNLIQTIATPGTQFIDKVPFTYGANFYYKVVALSSSGASSDITKAPAVTDMTFDDFEEKPFRATDISIDSFVVDEIPTGALNSSNLAFTTAGYFRANTLAVYYNGLRLPRTTPSQAACFVEGVDQKSFTLVVDAKLLLAAPASSDYLRVEYIAL